MTKELISSLRLKRLAAEEFDLVYPLLERSFPADERRDYEGQLALFQKPAFALYGFYMEGRFCGFFAVHHFETFTFIEHFAVEPSFRNCGLGSQALELLKRSTGKPIVLEAELPVDDLTKRRIAFYRRNGFAVNEYPYIMPALSEHTRPIPMKLLSCPDMLTEAEFETVKSVLYREVYNAAQK